MENKKEFNITITHCPSVFNPRGRFMAGLTEKFLAILLGGSF
jgi:hypothetical protein